MVWHNHAHALVRMANGGAMRKSSSLRVDATEAGEAFDDVEFLMSDEVAEWLRVSPATLCRWRQAGHGPRVTWMSKTCPRYRRSEVLAWLKKATA